MQSCRLMMWDIVGSSVVGENGTPYIDYIEIQWNRRWTSPGDFTIYMPFDHEVYAQATIARLEGRPETGIILKREVKVGTEGTFMTLSGFFAESALKWGTHLTQLSITASNWPTQIAKLIAETLTSYSSANRSHISGLNEEGYVKPTGQSSYQCYPILMHCEVGPIQSQPANGHSFTATTLTGDDDVCDWIYGVMPRTCSLRAHVFMKSDANNADVPTNLLPGGRGEFTKADLSSITPIYRIPAQNCTPGLVIGWELIDANTDSGLEFNKNNTYEMQMVLDESNACPISRAYFDDALAWWNNSYPTVRYSSLPGDEGTVYRAEEWYQSPYQVPGINANKYAGDWGFGKFFPTCVTPGDVSCEMVAGNRATIYSEILNSAKLGSLNYRIETQLMVKPEEIVGQSEYMFDYDIGTYVGIHITAPPRYGGTGQTYDIAEFDAQIVEINEVHSENRMDLSVVVEPV